MMRSPLTGIHPAFLGALSMLLGGCVHTDSTNFYVLTPLEASRGTPELPAVDPALVVGIGPIRLPSYLDRPQVVTRDGRNKLHLAEFDQWAEPLNDSFSRVLAENLSILVPAKQVVVLPSRTSIPCDYRVSVNVNRFECTQDGHCSLTAHWSISKEEGKRELVARSSSFGESATGGDLESAVHAMNLALEKLSRALAKAIREISE